MAQPADALVVGGGVIGLAAGYRLAERGAAVVLVDSGRRGASWAAAGMLAPVSEAAFGEDELTRLNLAAVPAFRALAAELADRTGLPVGLRTEGTLAVAFNADDRVALDRLTDFRTGLGLRTERLTGQAARALEPYLAAGVRGGVLAADDLSVDNRRYLATLRAAAEAAGVRFVAAEVSGLLQDRAGAVTGVRTATGEELRAGTVVLCGGASTAALLPVPVQPVKGQILRLAVPAQLRSAGEVLTHTVRGLVRGSEIYLVPRADGEVVVGATSEQQGHDTGVTAGGVYELLRNAYELLPISSEFAFVEACAGSRPGTPDNGPILGRVGDGLVVATGHYRNGILLSALTADAVAALVAGEPAAAVWRPFGPDRFAGDRTGSSAQPAVPA
ncbi:glycine oxidase ThiO [Jatrophihabitans sp.]|uniref:glycine oxidase ThiO n=1 Tax=Jatrophihabitans sp. TaxID=1932789 RepID=UPI002BBCD54B|nr:glycine oxidase ThiO [Jatrophihabitans sp.]